jgi:hypothetical protein
VDPGQHFDIGSLRSKGPDGDIEVTTTTQQQPPVAA